MIILRYCIFAVLLGGWYLGVAQSATLLPAELIETARVVLPGQSPGSEDDTSVEVFFPDLEAQFPTAIVLQGGLVAGSSYSRFGAELARFGYVVAIPNRLTPLGPPPAPPVPFPDQLLVPEVLAQLAVENADLGSPLNGRVDTERLGLVGHSVGGFVGLLVIEGSCQPPFCFPPFPFTTPEALRAGAFYGTNSFDPITGQLIDIETGDIPVALVNGSVDSISTVAEASATLAILDGPSELIVIDGANHYGITNTNNPPGAEPDASEPAISQARSIRRISQAIGGFLNGTIFNLSVSTLSNRSDKVPLQGTLLSEEVFIFLSPLRPQAAIRQVDFFLDGRFIKTERFAPYDLRGTPNGVPRPFDTRSLANGSHTVRADIQFDSGEIKTESATFEVANELFGLSVSSAPDRSNAVPLAGQTLSGDVFIFLTPLFPQSAIAEVDFFINGLFIKTESRAPYDLRGTASGGAARPFNTRVLPNFSYTLVADVILDTGNVVTVSGRFTVSNPR